MTMCLCSFLYGYLMSLRNFFLQQPWWGKIIGGFFGYLAMGSVGAIFGIFIGNLFDKGMIQHLSHPHWEVFTEKNKKIQELFFKSTFTMMGFIAKSTGRVSEEDILMAKNIIQEMRLKGEAARLARHYFREGKSPHFDPHNTLLYLRKTCKYRPTLINLFVDLQYRAAFSTGFNEKKFEAFNKMLSALGFASLNKQHRFYEDFGYSSSQNSSYDYRQSYQNTSQGSSQSQNQQTSSSPHGIDRAYALLQVTKNASQQEVKKAYRKLMSKNHPDKLIAQGLPENMIKMANEKTQAISKAYQQICESRGWH